MKKKLWMPAVVMMFIVLIGADIHRPTENAAPVDKPKKICNGYTIVEFGKGIDCNGDTIRLVKINGVQVAQREPS
jgi:hypothetical protein